MVVEFLMIPRRRTSLIYFILDYYHIIRSRLIFSWKSLKSLVIFWITTGLRFEYRNLMLYFGNTLPVEGSPISPFGCPFISSNWSNIISLHGPRTVLLKFFQFLLLGYLWFWALFLNFLICHLKIRRSLFSGCIDFFSLFASINYLADSWRALTLIVQTTLRCNWSLNSTRSTFKRLI